MPRLGLPVVFRSTLGYPRVNRLERKYPRRTEPIQFLEIGDEQNVFAVCIPDFFALEFLQSRCIAGLQILLNSIPIFSKLAGATGTAHEDILRSLRCWHH